MPYGKIEELPDSVREHLPEHAQEIYKEAFNAAWDQYPATADSRGDAAQEENAHRLAWGAVRQAYKQDADGRWRKLD